jgi:hypothetical protein
MADEIRSNLEPIEDSDLALDKKFNSKQEKGNFVEKKDELKNISSKGGKVEIKENLKEDETSYHKVISQVKKTDDTTDNNSGNKSINDAAEVISKEKNVETKVQSLVGIAENQGVIQAIKVAKHLDDNYILDELHDRLLSDELHDALVKRGFIKET